MNAKAHVSSFQLLRPIGSRLLAAMAVTTSFVISPFAFSEQPQISFEGLFQHGISLSQSSTGSLTVKARVGDTEAEFLLDTGASIITINQDLFSKLSDLEGTVKIREVGARLASGRLQLLDIYRVEHFTLGENCQLGPVEVAVIKRGGRNLLGMNALQAVAPIAIYTSPPALALSNCRINENANLSEISLQAD